MRWTRPQVCSTTRGNARLVVTFFVNVERTTHESRHFFMHAKLRIFAGFLGTESIQSSKTLAAESYLPRNPAALQLSSRCNDGYILSIVPKLNVSTMQIFVKTRTCPPGTRRVPPPSHLPDGRVSAAWLFLGRGISRSPGRDPVLVPGSRGRPGRLPRLL